MASKYVVGQVLYSLDKATQEGLLEPVCIKTVRTICDSGAPALYLYQDTWNALWNESDLITKAEAIPLAQAKATAEVLLLVQQINATQCVDSTDPCNPAPPCPLSDLQADLLRWTFRLQAAQQA